MTRKRTRARPTKVKRSTTGSKRGRPLSSIADWLPVTEAIARLKPLLGSELASHQLLKDIRGRRLPAASRCVRLRDGSETFERLTPAELESLNRLWSESYRYAEDIAERPGVRTRTDCWLFIDRRQFDKLYPAATASADNTMPPRAKPGPKPKGDWYVVLGAWLVDVARDDPKRLLNVDALVAEAASVLTDKIGWTPAETKELRQKIVEFLQFVRR